MGTFGITNNISEHVTLAQLMNLIGNTNHAVSVVGKCIFDPNYEKSFLLTIESFTLSCSCSDKNYTIEIFNEVYYAAMYVNPNKKPNCVQTRLDIIMTI